MIPPDSPMAQRDPLLGLCDVGTNAGVVPWSELESDWDFLSFLQGGLKNEGPSHTCPGASSPVADYCPSIIDQMDPDAAFGVKDHLSVLSEPATSDDSVSFQYPELHSNHHTCSNLEDPSSTAHVNEPYYHHTPYLGRDMEGCMKITNGFGPSSVDFPFQYWDNVQLADILNKSAFSSSVDLSAWTDDSSHLEENVQVDDLESPSSDTHPHCKQHLTVYKSPVRLCKWTNANGTVCGDELTCVSLPEHLIMHGIKNMARNHLMKCNWFGCRKKRLINRESIVRHIREVHLRLKRSPKGVKGPHP